MSKLSYVFTQGCASWSYPSVQVKLCIYTGLCILELSVFKLIKLYVYTTLCILELSMCSSQVACLHRAVHPGRTGPMVRVIVGIQVIEVRVKKVILHLYTFTSSSP